MKNVSRYFLRLAIIAGAVTAVSCNQSSQPSDADEAAIRKVVTEDFKKAWDAYDEAAMASLFLSNADLTFPTSPWIKSKDSIQKAFDRDLPLGITSTFEIEDLRFLDGTTAIVNVNAHFSGAIPDYWDSATAIMKKEGGIWKYAALRVMPMRQKYNAVEASIAKSWDQFITAFGKGDADASAGMFTAGAINMVPESANNVNREGVHAMFKDFLENNKVEKLKVTPLELEVVGPVAYQWGTFEQTTIPKKGKTIVSKSRFYAVWNLEADGTWRFHRFLFNALP